MHDQQKAERALPIKQTFISKLDSVPLILFVMLTLIGIASLSTLLGFADAVTKLLRSDCIR